jgi:hypothetical protein
MRRSELEFADPGLYIVDSDEPGAKDGIVVCGPFPSTPQGRRELNAYAARYTAMTKRPTVVSEVLPIVLPGRG